MAKPNKQLSLVDNQSPTPAKLKTWANARTEELENLYTSMREQLSNMPKDAWDDWDKQSFLTVGEIIAQRRADAVRQEISRMMELAGMSYGIERVIHQRKTSALKQLNKNNR
tara:strand:- start:24 stop:359 length:336 start_codon:yes stop_codon:yes gene_type:complete